MLRTNITLSLKKFEEAELHQTVDGKPDSIDLVFQGNRLDPEVDFPALETIVGRIWIGELLDIIDRFQAINLLIQP